MLLLMFDLSIVNIYGIFFVTEEAKEENVIY